MIQLRLRKKKLYARERIPIDIFCYGNLSFFLSDLLAEKITVGRKGFISLKFSNVLISLKQSCPLY